MRYPTNQVIDEFRQVLAKLPHAAHHATISTDRITQTASQVADPRILLESSTALPPLLVKAARHDKIDFVVEGPPRLSQGELIPGVDLVPRLDDVPNTRRLTHSREEHTTINATADGQFRRQ